MTLLSEIQSDLKQAMLDKDDMTRDTLRMFKSEVQKFEIDNQETVDDAKALSIINKMIKQRNESCEVYKKAGRTELLDNENKEIEVINNFLPKQLSDDETKKICVEIVKKVEASSIKDMGKVMNELKKTHADVLDFSKVGSILKTVLK